MASLLLAAGVRAAVAQSPQDLDALMQTLRAVTHVEARYREVVESALLQQPLSSLGALSYQAPDRIERRGEHGDRLLIAGDTLTLTDGGKTRVVAVSEHAALETFVVALRATFAGDLARLRALYDLSFQPQNAGWTLVLRPKARTTMPLFERIEIRGQDNRIASLDILEANGDRRQLQLSDLRLTTLTPDLPR